MTAYFVTGTDTDVGKTVISALLVRQLNAYYWKPVQSGTIDIEDKNTVREISQISADKLLPCVYELKAPLSPHEAARMEDKHLDLSDINMPIVDGPLIVEGAGGVYVPLNDKDMIIDLINKLKIETIVVARSGLGTINHTLLTLKALRDRQIPIKGVILNGPLNPKNKIAIEDFGNVPILGEVPFVEGENFQELDVNLFDL